MSVKKFLLLFMDVLVYIVKWYVRNYSNRTTDSMACLVGKTAIVTGGSSGIGYATSVLLASRGCRVIIACRRDGKDVRQKIIEVTDNPNIIIKYLDLSKLKSVRAFAEDIKKMEPKIDILVNNAGMGASAKCYTEDGLNTVMQVNYFGHFLLTHLLVEQMKASDSPSVIFLSSVAAALHNLKMDNLNITDCRMNAFKLFSFYASSKLCTTLAAQELGDKLHKYGIIVSSADPGVVRTPILYSPYEIECSYKWLARCIFELTYFFCAQDDITGAQTTFHLAVSKNVETGSPYFRCKPFMKPSILNNREFCKQIWKKSEELVQLRPEEKL